MTGDFLGQGVGDQLSGALLVLNPRRVWQGHPDRAPVDQKLNVHGIGMAGGDSYHQGLVEAVGWFLGPTVGGGEVGEHQSLKSNLQLYRRAGVGSKRSCRLWQ